MWIMVDLLVFLVVFWLEFVYLSLLKELWNFLWYLFFYVLIKCSFEFCRNKIKYGKSIFRVCFVVILCILII